MNNLITAWDTVIMDQAANMGHNIASKTVKKDARPKLRKEPKKTVKEEMT